MSVSLNPAILTRTTPDGCVASDALSETYRARDGAGRRVLLRVPRECGDGIATTRLQREAHVLAALRHPCVVALEHTSDSPPYLVTEYVANRLAEGGKPWPTRRVVALARGLAEALDALHSQGVVHAALAPSSVGLAADGSPRLLDLGCAYFPARPDEFFWLQADPRFVAPELVTGQRPTPLSDVYGLGAIVYTALAGVGPFADIPASQIVPTKAFQSPLPLTHYRPKLAALAAVVARAMDRVPERRYATAGAFARALAEAAAPSRGVVSMTRSLAVAGALLLAALGGERVVRQTPILTAPARPVAVAPAASAPPVVLSSPVEPAAAPSEAGGASH